MKAIIFARVSSKDQEEGHSIPSQIRRLTEYALKKNLVIAETFQITESSLKKSRKEFNAVINYINKNKGPFALIADTIDRVQRSFRETPILDELRKAGKIELHFYREGLVLHQCSNSSQLTHWDMGVLLASSFVRQLSDNVKRSQEHCIKNGQWVFSRPPYGYKNVTLSTGKKDVQVDEEQAPFVIRVFELYAQGNHSLQTIASRLKAESTMKTSHGKPITARTIELILKNPFYIGMMFIKKQFHSHKYQTLISQELFNMVQDIIYKRNKAPVQYAGKPILLRGLITCKKCGSTVCGDIKKQKYVYYSCHNSKRICVKKWIREERLVGTILEHFDTIQLTDEQVEEIIQFIENSEAEENVSIKHELERLNRQLSVVKERTSRLIDMHVDGKIDAQIYHMKLEEYQQEKKNIELQIKSYDTDGATGGVIAREVLEIGRRAKEIFMSSKLEEKQQLLGFFFSNLQLDAEKLDLELREPFNLMGFHTDQTVWRLLRLEIMVLTSLQSNGTTGVVLHGLILSIRVRKYLKRHRIK
jgi:site-specific DNA recombinase